MSEKSDSKDSWYDHNWTIVIIFLIALPVVITGVIFTIWSYPTSPLDWAILGQKGDFFGGHLGASANFAAFLILLAATLIQGKELKLQRQELQESRKINKEISNQTEKQALTMQDQLKSAEKERQINYFIRLLENTKDTEARLAYEHEGKMIESRAAFNRTFNVVNSSIARGRTGTIAFHEDQFHQLFKAMEICFNTIIAIEDLDVRKSCQDLFLTNYSLEYLEKSSFLAGSTNLKGLENFDHLRKKALA